jgi:hypothetical protein
LEPGVLAYWPGAQAPHESWATSGLKVPTGLHKGKGASAASSRSGEGAVRTCRIGARQQADPQARHAGLSRKECSPGSEDDCCDADDKGACGCGVTAGARHRVVVALGAGAALGVASVLGLVALGAGAAGLGPWGGGEEVLLQQERKRSGMQWTAS